jgi:hypothetical protein
MLHIDEAQGMAGMRSLAIYREIERIWVFDKNFNEKLSTFQ